MFILTASNAGRSVEGISKVTVTVDPSTYVIRSLSVQFDQGIGNISVTAKVTEYSPGQKFDKSTFICPVKDYKDADIIDLR
jgi:hypothetical protein